MPKLLKHTLCAYNNPPTVVPAAAPVLCRKFELMPIKFGFFYEFSSCSKIGPKTLYYIPYSR